MNKPKIPITVYPLVLVAVAGLIAQFSSARSAFDLITVNGWHAIGAALVIEGATVVEALVFIRSRNGYAALGLVVTMLASGVYNYTQASTAGAGLGQWQLIAMSVGPLAALVSVGLALGDELRKYESALLEWRIVQDELAQEQARTARSEAVRLEREARERLTWERQLEQRRLEAELERQAQLQATQLREEGLARRRAEAAARRAKKKQATVDAPVTRQNDNGAKQTPRWRDVTHFLNDTDAPDDLKPPDVVEMAQVSLRTAQRWLARRAIESGVHSDNGKE